MTSVVVDVPIATVSTANAREHWRARANRVRTERETVRVCLLSVRMPRPTTPSAVTMVRLSPRVLDDDNLAGALKAVRDEVAAFLGVDDSPRGPVLWSYAQQIAKRRSVTIIMGWAE